MTNIKHILLYLCLIVCAGAVSAAPSATAAALMQKMYLRMQNAKAVDIKFTIDGQDNAIQGSATIAADKFTFDTPQMAVWYNGLTQWTYLKSSSELSITEPTANELIATNPFAILSNYSDAYKVRLLPETDAHKRIELIPFSKNSGISKIVITVDKSGDWPKIILVSFDDTRSITLKVDAIKAIPAVPKSTFEYNTKKYPANEIIDLR